MDNPATEIAQVIEDLTMSPPSVQAATIDKYFLPDATFAHPMCRTGNGANSRRLIHGIYRWYKIISPKIELTVNTVSYDEANLLLWANVTQIIRIWLFPFYKSTVNFDVKLKLSHDQASSKYFIVSQEDLYQVDQVAGMLPGPLGLQLLVWLFQFLAAWICLLGAYVGYPITWIEENYAKEGWTGVARKGKGLQKVRAQVGGENEKQQDPSSSKSSGWINVENSKK